MGAVPTRGRATVRPRGTFSNTEISGRCCDLEVLATPRAVDRLGRQPADLPAPEPHPSGGRHVEPRDHVEERGLARAGRPDHREYLTGRTRCSRSRAPRARRALGDASTSRTRPSCAIGGAEDSRSRAALWHEQHDEDQDQADHHEYQSTYDETFSWAGRRRRPDDGTASVRAPRSWTMMMSSPDTVQSMRSGSRTPSVRDRARRRGRSGAPNHAHGHLVALDVVARSARGPRSPDRDEHLAEV